MTPEEAFTAYLYANKVIEDSQSLRDIDEALMPKPMPKEFTDEQRKLASDILINQANKAAICPLTVEDAIAAQQHAKSIIDACEDLEALDEASDNKTAKKNCPEGFSIRQRELVAEILVKEYMQAIGRC